MQRQLEGASNTLARSTEALSSGMRINKASDDAAGLAIASGLNARSRVYGQALRNINDGASTLSIAQGAVGQLGDVLIRLKELATQASNGTLGSSQRSALNREAAQLQDEFDRLVTSTTFNGRKLIDGQLGILSIQAGFGSGSDHRISLGLGDELSRAYGTGFNAGTTIDLGFNTGASSVIADFNGDGIMDIATAGDNGGGSTVSIALGNGDGTYQNETDFTSGSDLSGYTVLRSGDVDGDGKVDLVASSSQGFSVWFGNGTGAVGSEQFHSRASAVNTDLQLGDFNGDGVLDVAGTSTLSNNIAVTFLNSDGTQLASRTLANGASIRHIAVADINNDGKADIVAGSAAAGTALGVFLASGTNNFAARLATAGFAAQATRLAVGDFNHDGNLDVAASLNAGNITIGLGNGTGTFTSNGTVAITGTLNRVFVADFDGDGHLDVGGVNASGLQFAKGRGDGSFDASVTYSSVNGGTQASLGDANGDGVLDIISGKTLYRASTVQSSTLRRIHLTTRAYALDALGAIDEALERVHLELGAIGSMQSRLDSALGAVRSARDESESASSRITSADIAVEAAAQVRAQILQQTASRVLAQANQAPLIALRLLQN